jgi:hypothetical protein
MWLAGLQLIYLLAGWLAGGWGLSVFSYFVVTTLDRRRLYYPGQVV